MRVQGCVSVMIEPMHVPAWQTGRVPVRISSPLVSHTSVKPAHIDQGEVVSDPQAVPVVLRMQARDSVEP